MIGALLLCLTCFGTLGFSRGNDELRKVPACEDMAPEDIYLDLSDMDLQAIRKPIATSSKITCLNLAGNRIRNIASDAFDGLPEMHYLNLAGNPISYKDFTQTELPKLRTLVLDGPFSGDDYNYPSGSYYSNRDKRVPLSLPTLEKLSLQNYNQEERVRYSLQFLSIPNLTHLYLSDNQLTGEELSDFISNINNLTHLYLDGNYFYNLNGNWLQNVRYLSMDRNGIESLSHERYYGEGYSMIPRGMHNLVYLSLMNNRIETIDPEAFESSENLQSLNLAGNQIENFPRDASTYLVNLTNLTLSNNSLTSVPEICELKELRSLSLSGNKIKSITDTSFCNLQHLSAIYLKNNELSNIIDETFGHLPALLVLDLSRNKIASLSEYWIAPRNFIVELNLDANNFEDIDSMSLKGVNGLQFLSIGRNPMKIVTVLSLMDLPNSTRIDVSREHSQFPVDFPMI